MKNFLFLASSLLIAVLLMSASCGELSIPKDNPVSASGVSKALSIWWSNYSHIRSTTCS